MPVYQIHSDHMAMNIGSQGGVVLGVCAGVGARARERVMDGEGSRPWGGIERDAERERARETNHGKGGEPLRERKGRVPLDQRRERVRERYY